MVMTDEASAFVKQWETWTGTQQACVGAALISSLEPHAAFFLHNLLQQKVDDTGAIWTKEVQLANSPAFVNGLQSESRDVAVSQLLHHLPLLRSNNHEAARSYMNVLPRVFNSLLEEDAPAPVQQQQQPQQQWSELQQLLTYALIHPALTLDEKRTLAQLVQKLDDKGGQDMALSLLESEMDVLHCQQLASQWNPWNGRTSLAAHNNNNRVRRSNSLTPLSYSNDVWNSQDENGRPKPRSHSLTSTSERSGTPSTGSGSDCLPSGGEESKRVSSFNVPASGMRDVPSWLKSLRLHKYANLFAQMTYEEMLALTEEQLEAQGVTKGARHKIALSIQRLRERPALLGQLEKEIVETGNVQNALSELKTMLASPIKPYRGPLTNDDSAYDTSLSPSPSLVRDDTSGCSSLDGSTDSLAPRLSCSSKEDSLLDGKMGNILSAPSSADMPTVIVSAAPDTDSGGEGSETSGEEGLCDSYKKLSAPGSYRDCSEADGGQEDIAGQVTRILGKICTQLLVSASPSEENVSQFVALLDRCMNHEAFVSQHRRRLSSWKDQIQQVWHYVPSPVPAKSKLQETRHPRRWSNVAHYPGFYSDTNTISYSQQNNNAYTLFPPRPNRSNYGNQRNFATAQTGLQTHNMYGQHNHLMPGVLGPVSTIGPPKPRPLAPALSLPLSSTLSTASAAHCHPPLQHRNSFCVSALSHCSSSGNTGLYSTVSSTADPFTFAETQKSNIGESFNDWLCTRYGTQRARSAPMTQNVSSQGSFYSSVSERERDSCLDIDLNHRLESLCLSMTEHALEGANDL